MTLPVSFRPLAQDDVESAISWYGEERPALALAFASRSMLWSLEFGRHPCSSPQSTVRSAARCSAGFQAWRQGAT